MSDQQPQTPNPADIVIPEGEDNAEPKALEIDLDSGEVGDQPAADDTPPPAPKSKPRPQARIQALTQRASSAESLAAQLQRELAEARREAEEARRVSMEATNTGMENYEARMKVEAQAAEHALEAAIRDGDAKAQAEANRRLATASAALADVDAWKASQPKAQQQPQQQQPQQQPQQPQQQRPQEPEPISEAVVEWFANDAPWFSAVQIGPDGRAVIDRSTGRPVENPDFDEDMHQAAMVIHRQVLRDINAGKLTEDFIETPEYFQRINAGVQQLFPDEFEGTPAPAQPQQPTRGAPKMGAPKQPVAPANRSGHPGQNGGKPGGNRVVLSGEERQFVDIMVQNGTFRYAHPHPKAGQIMEKKDAYVEYAKRRSTEQQSQQAS